MNIKQPSFYGREEEIHLLFDAWLQAIEGKPQWVSFVAETGTGKTRLVQEFYRYISDQAYRQAREAANPENGKYQGDYDTANYWPESLPIETNRLGLNPSAEGLSDENIESLKDIPWLWWGMRGEDPGRRNPSECGCAARAALSHLELHTTILAVQKARVEANLAAAKEIGKWVVSQIPVAGPMFEIAFTLGELVHSGKRPFEKLLNGIGIRIPDERNKLQIKFQDLLVDSIFKFLEQKVPVILVLDDVQWFDVDTVTFVNQLVNRAAEQSLKLMIISTSWAREWDQSDMLGVFKRFRGTRHERPLGGIESKHVRAFLMSQFPGLSEADQQLLVDRANGNFRYLTELALALGKDPRGFFEAGDIAACLSAGGRRKIHSKQLEMDMLIEARFLALEFRIQKVLMCSSCQGTRFDPRLTSLVTRAVDQEGGNCEAATIEAINLAERPGSMVCSVEADLWEFLQGPYWRLIRQRQEEEQEEFAALQDAYRQIVMKGDGTVADSIVESLVVQWLEREPDLEQEIRLRARLLEAAVRSSRFHAGLHQLEKIGVAIAEAKQDFHAAKLPVLSPDAAVAALRIFNQYAFGAAKQEVRESLEELWERSVVVVLQLPIRLYLQDRTLPVGCDLPELIEWCEALVSFRQGLGHMDDYRAWLYQLCELQKAQLESCSPAPGTKLRHAATLLRLAEEGARMAKGRAAWDQVFEQYQQALAQIDQLDSRENRVLWARCQISILYFGQAGRRHYPEVQNWGDDHRWYCRCAEFLGDVLAEIEAGTTPALGSGLDEFGNEVMEVLLYASTLTVEYAYTRGHRLATEFLDRLRLVTQRLFGRIQRGGHVPISLAHAAMEADMAVVSMLSRIASVVGDADESRIPAIPGVMSYRLQSRRVGDSEALHTIGQISAVVDRYRQLGMLSMDMLRIFARISYDRLVLTAAGVGEAAKTFGRIVDDAILAKDGERAAYGEPIQLLDWLVKIFDRWLSGSPDADKLWQRLRDGYSRAPDRRFDGLVEMIRC